MPSSSYYIGIDPGFFGAVALLSVDGLVARVWPMPTNGKGNKRELDLNDLITIIRTFPPSSQVALEWPTGMPGDSPQAMLRFGIGIGQIDALLYAHEFIAHHVAPNLWKARLGLPGKRWDANSRQGVQKWAELYPQHAGLVYGPRDGILDGPLDALLLAHYLLTITESPVGRKGGKRPPCFRGILFDNQTNVG